MLFSKTKLASLLSLSMLATLPIYATAQSNTPTKFVIVAPQCLTKSITTDYKLLSSKQKFNLIETNEAGLNQLISAKDHQKTPCGSFINVTDAWNTYQNTMKLPATSASISSFLTSFTSPISTKSKSTYTIKYDKQVNQLLAQINPQQMWNTLTTLTHFPDRYANSDNGVKAAQWLKAQVEEIAKANGRTDVSTFTISTGSSYKQPSVVIKIGTSNEPGIVIGAHMDTLQGYFGSHMPGADDDGSGSVTVLEATRTLLSSGMEFKKPIYIIWYSAEEMGLVGSQHVVAEFKKKNILVDNVIHFDMTGYANKKDPTMWLISDNTNKELTDYLGKLIDAYVKKPIKYTSCGYACSDHATWNMNGYKAAIAFEAKFNKYNPYIHTGNDKMDILSLTHMTDFTKLAVAFAVELAEPVS